jgi:tRNA(Leu) C34 or U34 (ribose-2'-O)-methylase TrmL
VAIEITDGSKELFPFQHHKCEVMVFGPEGGSLPLKITDKFPVIKIPTKVCLNLATAVAVVAYDRTAKYK